MMIGRVFSETFPPRDSQPGEEVLSVQGLTSGQALKEINLRVRRGEIVGLAGLTGSGRTELARAIFGVRRVDQGQMCIFGKAVEISNPKAALDHNIGFLSEDRNEEGLVLGLSVKHNAALPSLEQRQRFGIVDQAAENRVVKGKAGELSIRTPNLNHSVEYLSGGNRQKVVLAKWLITDPDLLIFDEPTRGIDVGAKNEIWGLMRQLVNQGKAILMISSELPELIGMSDRIVVMHNGSIVGELAGESATEEQVMMLATYGE
jgi:ribose transport system ATP-binding protein